MPRFAQLIMGPAGSGKSTYCSLMQEHCRIIKHSCAIANLDPAAEPFQYEASIDIRELIQLEDVMEDEDLKFGPNGGLVYCMEYLAKNLDWLNETLEASEDQYVLFDCPGQIELYTHLPVMKQIKEALESWDFIVCGVFLVDSQFLGTPNKFISGVLSSLSCMIGLEAPYINIMSKVDMLPKETKKQVEKYLDPAGSTLMELNSSDHQNHHNDKYNKLTESICHLIDDYGMIRFLPLDKSDEESLVIILQTADMITQFAEHQEVRDVDHDLEGPIRAAG